MIRSYGDHSANERTFLAWVRTGLSIVALGIVVKKGSLVALLITGASPHGIPASGSEYLNNFGGQALVGIGIAVVAAAVVRFVRTALRIDDHNVHSVGILRASALLRHRRDHSGTSTHASASAGLAQLPERNGALHRGQGISLTLIGGTDARHMH
jgi:putative membrane protein